MSGDIFKSIPNGLPYRDNLILSNTFKTIDQVKTFPDKKELSKFIMNKNYDEIWIIGGEQIYKEFLYPAHDMCNGENNGERNTLVPHKIYMTYIDKEFECDTYFPEIDANRYRFISNTHHNRVIDSTSDYVIYDRVYKYITSGHADEYAIYMPFMYMPVMNMPILDNPILDNPIHSTINNHNMDYL